MVKIKDTYDVSLRWQQDYTSDLTKLLYIAQDKFPDEKFKSIEVQNDLATIFNRDKDILVGGIISKENKRNILVYSLKKKDIAISLATAYEEAGLGFCNEWIVSIRPEGEVFHKHMIQSEQ